MDATDDGSTPPPTPENPTADDPTPDDPTPDDPTPDDPTPDDPTPGAKHRSRRWVIAGGLALIVGAGTGVAAGFVRGTAHRSAEPVPAPLRAALADELTLLAAARAARHDGLLASRVADALVRDHAAHLAALQAAVADYTGEFPSVTAAMSPTTSPTASPSTATPGHRLSPTALSSLEQGATRRAAERAAKLAATHRMPSAAALLASIAACEATHVALLT